MLGSSEAKKIPVKKSGKPYFLPSRSLMDLKKNKRRRYIAVAFPKPRATAERAVLTFTKHIKALLLSLNHISHSNATTDSCIYSTVLVYLE